jgi:HSP20 family molecular chaperone IbpA
MLFPRDGLLSQFGQNFNDSVRSALPTVAEPAWFVPPIDAREDDQALTVIFRVTDSERKDLRVRANRRNIFIWGPPLEHAGNDQPEPRRAMRVFALPFDFSRRDLRISHVDDLLHVRVAKRRARAQSGSTECAA